RRWLGEPPPSAATINRVLAVARGDVRAAELPGGDRVERAGGRLTRITGSPSPVPASVPLRLPGRARFGRWDIAAWIEHDAPAVWPDGRAVAVCDADAVGDDVAVRAAAAGERLRPLGATGSKLVRDALAEGGIPAGVRDHAPIVVADGPIWLVGYRIDHRVRVTARTRRYLWLSAEPVSQ
ncbi:MAG TPA: tRNA lysidine(34) synthetase TilS, partial [Acidimicrobiia bacterium]|nr:tRNA lysidine(34) synthetase TilS [Acidimicrobiia bacterium]